MNTWPTTPLHPCHDCSMVSRLSTPSVVFCCCCACSFILSRSHGQSWTAWMLPSLLLANECWRCLAPCCARPIKLHPRLLLRVVYMSLWRSAGHTTMVRHSTKMRSKGRCLEMVRLTMIFDILANIVSYSSMAIIWWRGEVCLPPIGKLLRERERERARARERGPKRERARARESVCVFVCVPPIGKPLEPTLCHSLQMKRVLYYQ